MVVDWVHSHEVLVLVEAAEGRSKDTQHTQEESSTMRAVWKGFAMWWYVLYNQKHSEMKKIVEEL